MDAITAKDLGKDDLVSIFETLEAVERVRSKEDYLQLIPEINNLIPFGVLSHALVECRANDQGLLEIVDHFQVGTYPSEWTERYAEMNYGLIDPVIHQNLAGAFGYQRWQETYKMIEPLKQFQMEADDFGLADGITIGGASVRQPEFSVLSLSGEGIEFNGRSKFIVQRLINTLHQALRRAKANSKKPSLTKQQKIVLDYLKQGMSQKVIADRMFLSPDRIKGIISEIRKRLDAENAVHSVYQAMLHGEI